MGWVVAFIVITVIMVVLKIGAAIVEADNNKALGISSSGASRGTLNAQMVCPHCQQKGKILTKRVTKKAGISGGKATGAVLTGGVSLLATGLSRMEELTEAYCDNCSSTWHF